VSNNTATKYVSALSWHWNPNVPAACPHCGLAGVNREHRMLTTDEQRQLDATYQSVNRDNRGNAQRYFFHGE
jgi:hypothetical protein